MLERRTLLAGLAALPAAGLPIAVMAVDSRRNPFAAYQTEALALNAAVCMAESDDASEAYMDRLAAIDAAVMRLRPTTLGEAASALAFARREHLQYAMLDGQGGGDLGDRLVLHLIDGVLAVLRQAAGGGVA